MGISHHLIVMLLAVSPLVSLVGAADAGPELGEGTPIADKEHRSAPDPVRIDLSTDSPIALSVPFLLEVTLTATWRDLDDVTFSLTLPEGLTADMTAATVDLTRDVPTTLSFTLTPTEAGTHEVLATAVAILDFGKLGGDRLAYAVVPKVGVGEFHQDLVPPPSTGTMLETGVASPPSVVGVAKASEDEEGLVFAKAAVPSDLPPAAPHEPLEGAATEEASGPTIQGHATFQLRVCWFYENEASPPVDTPQRGATVQVWDEDDISDDLLAEGVTGGDGCYQSGDISREDQDGGADNQDLYVRIHLCNTWLCVQNADEDFQVFRIDVGDPGSQDVVDIGGRKPVGGANFGARAFQYGYNSAWFAANRLQADGWSNSGPQVEIWAPSDDGNCDDGGMFFRRSENRIHVCSDSDRSPEDIGHEYGHWVHWALYGQDDDAWPSPGGAHSLCGDNQNRGLSWTEGWGNFFGPRVGLEVSAPSADGNTAYDRPWDGSSFSMDMEAGTWCGSGVVSDDNEMNVAFSLWDIRDVQDDGTDTGSTDGSFIADVVSACDDDNFRDFYDGGCSWISQGGDACTFQRAAFQNRIDFNDNVPTVSITSQASFVWVRDILWLTATAADADPGCVPATEFRISHDNVCNGSDTLAGNDIDASAVITYDTNGFSDDGTVWTCVRATDGMEPSGWSTSASHIGVDNTDPSVGIDLTGTMGESNWWVSPVTVSLPCSDNLSGVNAIRYRLDGGSLTTYSGAFVVSSQGDHSVTFECEDNAGNLDTGSGTFRIDSIDPQTTAGQSGATGENGWYVGDVTVTMSCSDFVPGSGCASTEVAHTFPDSTGGTFLYTAPFVVTGDGVHTIGYHSVDVAGNVETAQSFNLAIDTLPPTGEIVSATDGSFTHTGAYLLGGIFTNEPTLVITYHATDAASGMQFVSVDGGEVDAYSGQLDVTGTLTIALTPGITTWTITIEDMAGHTATLGTFSVVYVPDGTHPTVDPRASGWWRNAPKIWYGEAAIGAMLPLVNTASHSFGTPDERYDPITMANYDVYFEQSPPTLDERVRKELAAAWMNLVSGREPAAQAVQLSTSSWQTIVPNTNGGATTAYNVVIQVEARLAEGPNDTTLSSIKNLLSALNTGGLNT